MSRVVGLWSVVTGYGRCARALTTLALLAVPGDRAAAQGGRCTRFEFRNTPNTRLTYQRLPSGNENIFIGAGVNAYCATQQLTIIADSAEHYGDLGVWYLIGSVRYIEPRVRVTSRRATYWTQQDRLLAEGDVVATLPSGTTMRGPRAEYWRDIPGVRVARLEATGRPVIRMVQRDTTRPPGDTAAPADTVDIVANSVVSVNDSLVYASGAVEITRPDMVARGDSAFVDSGREFARLMRGPSITGSGERPFTLTGTVIDSWSRERKLERVLAAGSARATSREAILTADTIDLRVENGDLSRAYAWGRSRAVVESPTQRLIADSLDVLMPGQRLTQVRAIRAAYAESAPDTSRIPAGTPRDWLRGDSVYAWFDTLSTATTPPRTDAGPRLRQLVAFGTARSLYHLPSNDARTSAPALNYVRGRRITVDIQEQSVQTVSVVGQASGVYLEPALQRPAPADTSAPVPAPTPPATPPSGTSP